jgi:amino acid adenylation domain-containing protein
VHDFDGPPTIHALFEEHVRRYPDQGEIRTEQRRTPYAQVNADANRLARVLVESGVARGDLVCICLEPSVELVVAMLAVLKAGAAFVPMDPTHPSERLAHIRRDSAANVILCNSATSGACSVDTGAVVVNLDDVAPVLAAMPATDLALPAAADDLIYVMYTSGSTGLPKGAMLTHGGIRNRLLWGIDAYGLGARDGVLFKTSVAFDVCIWEIFAPLLSGANLVVARSGGVRDVAYLKELIDRERVTHADFVPSMMSAFLTELEPGDCAGLRVVTCAGEALTAGLLDQIFAALPVRVYNLYGPTEASLAVTHWSCTETPADRQVPIGRAMSNVALHVLRADGQPVVADEVGELYIGGAAPGLGYLHQPERTRLAFLPDTFIGHGHMYRTGDLVRVRDDGELMFLGRVDHQVKLRGVRLELGEVEAQLASNALVRDAVVLMREFGPDDQRLVAYVTLHAGVPSEAARAQVLEQMRQPLAEILPANVVPAHFVVLDGLPLTPNGKADRQALGELPLMRATLVVQAAGAGGLEERLRAVWASVLGVEKVGDDDDFFALGGHSLLAVKLVARLRKEHGLKVSIGELFEKRSVRGIAALVSGRAQGAAA